MTRSTRKHPRPGSYLPAVDAADLIARNGDLADFHADLTRRGFLLTNTVRPYLTKRGKITFRLVWRKRRAGLTTTCAHTQSVSHSDLKSGANGRL